MLGNTPVSSGPLDELKSPFINLIGISSEGADSSASLVLINLLPISVSVTITENTDRLAVQTIPITFTGANLGFGAMSSSPLSSDIPSYSMINVLVEGADISNIRIDSGMKITAPMLEGTEIITSSIGPILPVSSAAVEGADVASALVGPLDGVTFTATEGSDVSSTIVGPLIWLAVIDTEGADTSSALVTPISGSVTYHAFWGSPGKINGSPANIAFWS